MWLPAALGSALVSGVAGFLLKVSSYRQYPGGSIFIGFYLVGSSIFLAALLSTSHFTLTPLLLLFAILIGCGSFFYNTFLIKAYDLGPASLTSPLANLSIVFVIILCTLIYQENISHWQYLGIFSMLAGVSLLGLRLDNQQIKSKMWIVFVMLTIIFVFMREGGLKIAHENGLDSLNVLLFAYLFAFTFAMIRLLMDRNNGKSIFSKQGANAFLLGGAIGLFSSLGLILLTYALARGPGAIIVPIFSTRSFIVVLLVLIFYKEKLTRLQWVALGLLLIGVSLIQ